MAALFIPLNPRMPNNDAFDSSWEFAMNQVVARHLVFGKEVLFTYGPYGSVMTRTYDPATDLRMILGSLLLCVAYSIALLYVVRSSKRYLAILLLLFLATFGNMELVLLSYAFLLVVCVLKHANANHDEEVDAASWRHILAVLVVLSALGLLPLVKGSLLLPFITSVGIPAAFFLSRGCFRHAMLWLSIPAAAALIFWVIAGESLANLPGFLRGTVLLTSGYTEAMASTETILPAIIANGVLITVLAASAAVLVLVSRATQLTTASKWALGLLCALFLLVAFKHNVIKSDNIPGAFSSLSLFILIIGFLCMDRYLVWLLCVVVVLTTLVSVRLDSVLINEVHDKFGVGVTWGGSRRADVLNFCLKNAAQSYSRMTYKTTWNTYHMAWDGLRLRLHDGNELGVRYEEAKANIRQGAPVPALMGSVDIYTYDLSALLASNNEWNPRPIMLSYNAMTPVLAGLNEQHLRGPNAPDWVLFDLMTMGGHLPSLDDGVSWPALLDNYTFISFDGRFALLRKDKVIHASGNYEDVLKGSFKAGETVRLPETDGLLFAEVDLKPTLLGSLQTAVFRPPQLHIVLALENGENRRYRVISNEMVTGFFVSPLVSNTSDFVTLIEGKGLTEEGKRVKSISIAPSYGGSVFWAGTYGLTLKRYIGQ
jgi:hypothetical protein